jgi:hypothetical protein
MQELLEQLLTEDNEEDFEDVFEPVSNEEALKRIKKQIFDRLHARIGDIVSDQQIEAILWALAIDPNIMAAIERYIPLFLTKEGES